MGLFLKGSPYNSWHKLCNVCTQVHLIIFVFTRIEFNWSDKRFEHIPIVNAEHCKQNILRFLMGWSKCGTESDMERQLLIINLNFMWIYEAQSLFIVKLTFLASERINFSNYNKIMIYGHVIDILCSDVSEYESYSYFKWISFTFVIGARFCLSNSVTCGL